MTENVKVTWVLEADVFPDSCVRMREAVLTAGLACVSWNDDWLRDDLPPALSGQAVIFHGSLGNAAAIRQRFCWRPGSFCEVSRFHCSHWYARARPWLLHREWHLKSVAELTSTPAKALGSLSGLAEVFVRPDSPLKPFSGRVLQRDRITLEALDHGFYYDDQTLAVIVAPVRSIGREWRYVVVDRAVVAGSAYAAAGRKAIPDEPGGEPWRFAAEVAAALEAPEPVYVLDVCEADGGLHLLELNPFSGADLYACDRAAVVRAVSAAALRESSTRRG